MADLIFYDKAAVKVTVGNTSEVLLASDCSISFSSSVQPLYTLGRKGSLGQFPSAARAGEISFSFLTSITGEHDKQPGNIINYLASGVKGSINSNASGALIQVAGLSGTGFLNSYSFNVASNSVSTSSASFTLFGSGAVSNNQQLNVPISGRLANSEFSPSTGATPAAATNSVLATGIAHGRFTNLDGFRTELTGPTSNGTIFGADYSVSFNHNPIYKVGQEFPTCTYYTTASESMNITEDVFNSGLSFSGVDVGDVMLNVKGLDGTKQMQVGLSGLKQINSSASVGLDDIVRTQKTLVAAY
tara:strand:+ start:2927 stop:3832 length:906 start_codon:yes stop_codon:yes gene_type:complete